jgi:AsmA family protein
MSSTKTPRQRLRPSRRTWIFGSLATLAVAIIAIVLLFDWNWLKGPLENQVSSRLGRPFRIAGDLDVDLGLHPRITINDASLANPPWASDQPMLEVQRAEFVVDLPALWHGRVELPELNISKPALRLETRPDGPPNWRFKQSTGGGPPIPEIGELRISDASVRYLAHGTGQSVVAHLDEVSGSTNRPGEDRGLALTGSGAVDDQPLHLKLSGPPLADLRRESKPYPVALDLQLGQSDVAGDVTLDLGKDMPAATARLHSNRVVANQFAGLLSAAKGGEPAAASGTNRATPAERTPGTAPAAVNRIESLLNKLDFGQLPAVDLDLDYSIKDLEGPDLALHDVEIKTDLHDQVPKLALDGQGTYKGQPVTLDVKAGPAQPGQPAQGYQVDADIEAGKTRITATGATDHPKDLKGLHVQLAVESPDPTDLLRQLGFKVPELPGLQAKGELTRNGDAWRLADLDAKVGESDLSGSLAVDFSGARPLLTADLRSDRLAAKDLMPGKGALPASTERPVVPPAGISLKGLPDVDADVKFQGEHVQVPQLVLQQLKLDLKLRNRVAIGDVTGEGTFREYKPIAFEIHAGDDQSLDHPQARYPLDVALHAGATKAGLKGSVDHPLNYTGLDADLALQGQDLEALGKVLGLPLPSTPPYRLAGKITHQPDHERWNLVAIDGKVADSDLEGDVSLELSGERPTIVADLKSKRLDLDDLGVLVGAPPATGPGETASPAERQQAEAAKASPRILPDKPLSIPSLDAVDARVSFTGETVQAKKVPIQNLSLKLTLENGKLRLEPLRLELAGGQLEAKTDLESRDQVLAGNIDLTLKQIKLNELLSRVGIKLAKVKIEKEGAGTFGGGAELKTHGESIHDLAANANGEVVIIMDGGQINALIIEAMGLDVGEILGLLVTEPKEGAATTVPIECFVGRFGVHDGVMTSQALVLDTTDSTITGKGDIDLGKESVNLELLAHPKDASVLTANTPVRIEGTLKHPKVDVVSKELGEKSLAALALGVVLPVIGAVLPFVELGETKGSNCGQLLADAKAAMPPAAKDSAQ